MQLVMKMNFSKFSSLFWLLVCLVCDTRADYHCGIRKHLYRELINRGWKVEDGQWPWHAGLFHKIENGTEYRCGGTLIDQKYVLTAAHCVADRQTFDPEPAELFLLYFGLTKRLNESKHMQKRDITTIHVYPHYSTQRNDIALLELRLPVEFTPFVIPICLGTLEHRDLQDIEGQRGYVTGWGMTENGTLSDELRSASMPVVDNMKCLDNDRNVFGKRLTENVFCAGDLNGTSPAQGDSGGGMYFSEGGRWVLRGIVSFAKYERNQLNVDTSKFVVFTNVQRFLAWIREVTDGWSLNSKKKNGPKRISQMECDRFKTFVKKHDDGSCMNNRFQHIVSVKSIDGEHKCNGILLNENHVLTSCECTYGECVVRIGEYGTVSSSSSICYSDNDNDNANDIAVIKLSSTIPLSLNIIPACLASNETENLYDTLQVNGFRKRNRKFFERPTDSLEFFQTRVTASEQCKIQQFKDQLCTVKDKANRLSNLPFGTALQSFNSRTCLYTVMGSRSQYTHDAVVYTRVANYLNRIEETVWGKAVVPYSTTNNALEKSTTTKRISARGKGTRNAILFLRKDMVFATPIILIPMKNNLKKGRELYSNVTDSKALPEKSINGSCLNGWSSHRVSFHDDSTECSGYLINENHVLTTWDCEYHSRDPMRLGGYDLFRSKIFTYQVTRHPMGVIVIVRLAAAVHLSYQIIPACLESDWTENINDAVLISDFGDYSGTLIALSDRTITTAKTDVNQMRTPVACNRDDTEITYDDMKLGQFCVRGGLLRPSKFSFGAHAVNNQTCLFTMVGVSSDNLVFRNMYQKYYSLVPFTRMAHYLDWIEEIVWGEKADSQSTATTSEEPTPKQ